MQQLSTNNFSRKGQSWKVKLVKIGSLTEFVNPFIIGKKNGVSKLTSYMIRSSPIVFKIFVKKYIKHVIQCHTMYTMPQNLNTLLDETLLCILKSGCS